VCALTTRPRLQVGARVSVLDGMGVPSPSRMDGPYQVHREQ